MVIVLRTAGGLSDTDTSLPLTPTAVGLFFVIAFVTGFRDTVFLGLIADVATVVFKSGTSPGGRASYSIDASEVDFGPGAGLWRIQAPHSARHPY